MNRYYPMRGRRYGYEDSSHEAEGVDGDQSGEYAPGGRPEGGFFDPQPGHWAGRLHLNPNRPMLGVQDPEGADEQQWGQTRLVTIATTGTGPAAKTVEQLIQVTRTARVWGLDLSFSLVNVNDIADVKAPNATITVTFIVQLGIGAAYIKRYVQLFDTDLVTFAPDPSFPLRQDPAVASVILSDLPAKQVIVSAQVKYDRILLASPDTLNVNVSAALAPVMR